MGDGIPLASLVALLLNSPQAHQALNDQARTGVFDQAAARMRNAVMQRPAPRLADMLTVPPQTRIDNAFSILPAK